MSNLQDPIYKVWFPEAFAEQEDPELVKAIEEIEQKERELQDD